MARILLSITSVARCPDPGSGAGRTVGEIIGSECEPYAVPPLWRRRDDGWLARKPAGVGADPPRFGTFINGEGLNMQKFGRHAVTATLMLASAGIALADDAKPAAPSLGDVLAASGITATGYVDGTYSYQSYSPPASSTYNYNTFALNQASLSVAYTPSSGFGALVNAVAGTEACNGCYAPGYSSGSSASTSSFNLLQAYAQYVAGKATLYVGKFTTLAGAEVAAPTGDTNITRSLLYWYNEPLTHVGARLAYAATDTFTFTVGVNNGWNTDASLASGKTYEVGATFAPSKAFSLAGAVYYTAQDASDAKKTLVDLVATYNATSALTFVLSGDYDKLEPSGGSSSTWWGVAGYANYAFSDTWRTSFRAEYLKDSDGYNFGIPGKGYEGTLTFGYMPSKHFEARIEGRYDSYKPDSGSSYDVTQGWLQALYKF